MSQLAQGVGLVDNLAQLTSAEEIVNAARDAFGIYQVCYAQGMFGVPFHAHPFLDGSAQLKQTFSDFIGCQFIDRAQSSVAQVIDIVNLAFIVAQSHYVLHRLVKVFGTECHFTFVNRLIEGPVDPETPDPAEAVAVRIKELLGEKRLGLILVGWIAGSQSHIEFQKSLFVILALVFGKRIQNKDVSNVIDYFYRRLRLLGLGLFAALWRRIRGLYY